MTRSASLVRDRFGRRAGSLRVSVTDRCNIRCRYCMPEDEYAWLPRASILSFEEITRVTGLFASLGVAKIRITGGEPLLRRGLPQLIKSIVRVPGVDEVALTTNGVLLSRYVDDLKQAGLSRVTVSLDTLNAGKFRQFTKSDRLESVLDGIATVRRGGFVRTKLNSVVIRGFNDDELHDLIEFARANGCEVRFIEYMDVGGATRWSADSVVTREEILASLSRRYGTITPVENRERAVPAERFRLEDGLVFGVISSTTAPFCSDCDRSRITADGMWFLCLYADTGCDLKGMLRSGLGDDEISARMREIWVGRTDRGAEERLALSARGALYQIESLRSDPHREMHTRGG